MEASCVAKKLKQIKKIKANKQKRHNSINIGFVAFLFELIHKDSVKRYV